MFYDCSVGVFEVLVNGIVRFSVDFDFLISSGDMVVLWMLSGLVIFMDMYVRMR